MTPTTLRSSILCCLSSCLLACAPAPDELIDDDESAAEREVCGPKYGVVSRVIDGDTIVLESGERVRYLMIDTPEVGGSPPECWGEEAKQANISFVEGAEVELTYDVQCTDKYDRLLAYVWVDGTNINELMVQRGHACVMHIPPNGSDEVLERFLALEEAAKTADPKKGLWGDCDPPPC